MENQIPVENSPTPENVPVPPVPPVTPIQSSQTPTPSNGTSKFKYLGVAVLVVALGAVAYFLAGSGLFKGFIGGDLKDLNEYVEYVSPADADLSELYTNSMIIFKAKKPFTIWFDDPKYGAIQVKKAEKTELVDPESTAGAGGT